MLEALFEDFPGGPGALVQFPACLVVSLHKEFNFAEDHFEEKGLGTGPSAPDAAKGNCEDDDKQDKGEHQQGQDKSVLGPENRPEDDEFPVGNIEQNQGIAVNFDKWGCYEKGQKEIGHEHPAGMPFPRGFLGIHPFAVSLLVDIDGTVAERIFFLISHLC